MSTVALAFRTAAALLLFASVVQGLVGASELRGVSDALGDAAGTAADALFVSALIEGVFRAALVWGFGEVIARMDEARMDEARMDDRAGHSEMGEAA